MAPLIILATVFVLASVIEFFIKNEWGFYPAGRIAMAAMLLFTAVAHFLFTEGMIMMLPDFIPLKKETVYLGAFIEIAAAIGLLIPRYQKLTSWLLILFFILILPSNIYAAIHHVNFQTATYDGNGLNYLWFRVPLQALFIVWVYYFGIKNAGRRQ